MNEGKDMGKRVGRVLAAALLCFAMFAGGAGSAAAVTVPTPVGDRPVFIPGTQIPPSAESDTAGLQESAFIDDITAGDTPISVQQAGASRSSAFDKLKNFKVGTQTFNSSWAPLGPNPIGQIQRTTGALTAESGRIGALAILPNGRFILGGAQGGVWTMDPVTTGTPVWVPRTDNLPSLATGALAVAPSNPMVVYDGTGEGALSGDSYFGNGIMRSTDGGTTWSHVSGDFFVGVSVARLAIDPNNANHLYAAVIRGRGGAHRTTPAVHSAYGIWESTNGGVTWKLLKGATTLADGSTSQGATDLRIDPITPNILYASFLGDAIYKSTDGGKTWNTIMNGLPAANVSDFVQTPTRFNLGLSHPSGQSAVLYTGFDWFNAGTSIHRGSRVFKSVDGGANWTVTSFGTGIDSVLGYCGTQCTYDNVIETDPTNPNVVFAAGSFGYTLSPPSGGIYRSDDGGASWKNLGADQHPDFHSVVFDPNNSQNVLIGSDGGVWYSPDQGGRVPGTPGASQLLANDWIDLNGNPDLSSNGLQITQFSSIATNPTRTPRFWGGTQDNGTMREVAGVPLWVDVTSGDGGNVLVDPTDWHFVYGTFFAPPTQIYRITDGGSAFFQQKPITNGINVNDRAEFYIPMAMNQLNTNQLFTGTYRVYRTDNAKTPSAGDVVWQLISPDLTSGCTGPAPNGARNCTLTSIGVGGGTAVYAGSNDGLLWVSPDAQTSSTPTWIQLGNSGQNGNEDGEHSDVRLPQRPVSSIAVDRSNWRTAYVAYNGFDAATPKRPGHIFKTTDGGQSFRNITSNLPDTPVNWLVLDPAFADTIYAGTDIGAFVTYNGGGHWYKLGASMPIVSVEQLNLDTFHRVLAAGTHGRGAWSLADTSAPAPALVFSKVDAGVPVGPGSFINYTLTLQNIGNGGATNVRITDPLPDNTSFVSADNGGTFEDGRVTWRGLSVPAGPAGIGASISVHLRVKIDSDLSSSVKSIVNDGVRVRSAQNDSVSGSPTVTPIAPPFGVSISPAAQTGGAHVNVAQNYTETVKNLGYKTDHYSLSTAGGTFPVTFFDSNCTTPLADTGSLIAGATKDVCVKVTPPGSATDGATSTSTVTATSTAAPPLAASASITTIAVTVDTLLVNEDGGAGTVSFYDAALTGAGVAHDTWDLNANPTLAIKYMEAFKNIVWFTGVSYPGPLLPYERNLAAYLDNGGHLMVSGQDILDQGAGTTDFVKNYLHINWDGSEKQNDIATANFHGVAGTLTNGIGTVPRTPVLGAPFMDQLTLNGTATGIFTDDAGQTDGLSFTGTYKLVFLAFGFEEYGSAADKVTFITDLMTFFGP
ncbi:MAG TPA: hypothetical protein VLK30_05565 [Candidatus Limnocylindrales bacterium]|nr:hypothetical protein [Candidatus Limnocylindrales bacterium]